MHLGCIIASTTKAAASSDGWDECELSCLIKYAFGLHICDDERLAWTLCTPQCVLHNVYNTRVSCYLSICLLHVHIKPYFRKHALAFMNMSPVYSDLRGNILYEVVSSFMPLGIYSIIMSHKLHGGNSHNIPACNHGWWQIWWLFWICNDDNNNAVGQSNEARRGFD